MTLARAVHACGAIGGLAVAVVAGFQLGGWWWVPAALAGVGSVSGRSGALVQAVAALGLVGGAAAQDVTWLVPLLVLGVFASVEASTLPARITRVRPRVPALPVAATAIGGAATSAAVLLLSELGPPFAVPTALAAAVAAAVLLATLRA